MYLLDHSLSPFLSLYRTRCTSTLSASAETTCDTTFFQTVSTWMLSWLRPRESPPDLPQAEGLGTLDAGVVVVVVEDVVEDVDVDVEAVIAEGVDTKLIEGTSAFFLFHPVFFSNCFLLFFPSVSPPFLSLSS